MKTLSKTQGGKYLLGLLQNLYCSCQSETSAFMLFNYQGLVVKNKELSQQLLDFAQVHLNNSRILAQLILQKGGLPFYTNVQLSPLTAFWLQPDSNKSEVLKIDKNFLTALNNNYTLTLSKIKNQTIIKKLSALQQETLNHLKFFSEYK